MEFNINEMSLEELKALEEAIQAKLAEMEGGEEEEREGEEAPAEAEAPVEELAEEVQALVEQLPEEIEKLEELVNEIADRKRALKKNAEKRSALIKRIADGQGSVIRKYEQREEGNTMNNEKLYRSAWLKNLQGKPLNAEERTAAVASAAIPTETMNQIVHKLELLPIVEAVDVTHIPGNVTWPVESAVADAAWVAMGTAATDSTATLAAVTLGAYKLIKTVEITADVAAMAIDAFETWLVDRLANKIGRAVAAAICTGTGSSQAAGLSKLTAAGTYTKAAMKYKDLMGIIAALGAEYMPNASFVCSRATFFGEILGMEDTNGQRVVVADAQAPCKFNIMGFPVIIEDGVGTDVYFGDLKEGYKFNFAKDIEVARDESVAFRTGSTVFRAMALCDGKTTGVGIVRFTKATA